MIKFLRSALLLALCAAFVVCKDLDANAKPSKVTYNNSVVAFLCADNGTFSGTSELALVSSQVFQQEPIYAPYCQSAFFGYTYATGGKIVGVVLATTGIGEATAALCTQSLLVSSGLTFSKMIFVGTSGISPVIGGLNPAAPGGCEEMNAPTTIAVGSVCVTHAAVDMSCGMCISNPVASASDLPNECSRPNCNGHLNEAMYGTCTQTGSAALASSIFQASAGRSFSPQPAAIATGSALWWAAHEAVDYETRTHPPLTPSLLSNCVEADAHQIWVGAPLDYLCREYSAELLGSAHSAQSVPCVVAMESTGFLNAVNGFNSGNAIEAAVVRAAANWDMYPLTAPSGNLNTSLRWLQNTTYVSDSDHLAFVKAAYQYAVRTSNEVILNFIKSVL